MTTDTMSRAYSERRATSIVTRRTVFLVATTDRRIVTERPGAFQTCALLSFRQHVMGGAERRPKSLEDLMVRVGRVLALLNTISSQRLTCQPPILQPPL